MIGLRGILFHRPCVRHTRGYALRADWPQRMFQVMSFVHCINYWYLNLNRYSSEQQPLKTFKMVKIHILCRVTWNVHVDRGTRHMLGWGSHCNTDRCWTILWVDLWRILIWSKITIVNKTNRWRWIISWNKFIWTVDYSFIKFSYSIL